MNSVATESSGQWASTQDTLAQSATATTNDSSSFHKIDKANTNLSSYSTHSNEGQIDLETNFITPPSPPLPPIPSRRASPITEVSTEQTYGTQVRIDNKAQSAHLPSDRTDASQLPPLVPVRRSSQSQHNDQAQSATTSPPVSRNIFTQAFQSPIPVNSAALQEGHELPSKYSHESHRVPTAQKPQIDPFRTSGDNPPSSLRINQESWDPNRRPSLTPRQYTTPLQQRAPATPFMYSGTSSQPYRRSQSVVTPQPQSWGSAQPFITHSAPPQPYGLPGVPTPQPPRRSRSLFDHIPSRQPFPTNPYRHPTRTSSFDIYDSSTANPQTSRKASGYVATDPFQMSHHNDKADAASDELNFDDISTARSSPRPSPTTTVFPQPAPSRLYHSLPSNATPQAQSIHEYGTPHPFIPPPRIPNAPTPHAGTSQQFVPQMYSSQYDQVPFQNAPHIPSRFSRNAFVGNDPFQTSRGDEKVDEPSSFDEIPTAPSASFGALPSQPTLGGSSASFGALPSQPIFEGYFTDTPPGAYGQSPNSIQPGIYSTLNDSQSWYQRTRPGVYPSPNHHTQIPIRQSSWSSYIAPHVRDDASEHQRPPLSPESRRPTPFISPFPQDDTYDQGDLGPAQPPSPPHAPTPVPSLQSLSPVPSVHSSRHSPIIVPNADHTVIPPVPSEDRSSSPSADQNIPFTPHEPQTANQSPFGPYDFNPPPLPYLPYPYYSYFPNQYPYYPNQYPYYPNQYPYYLQYPQHQYPDLPKKSIFSWLTSFFRQSQRTHPPANPQPFTAIYPQPFTQPYTVIYPPMSPEVDWYEVAVKFLLKTFPKQMYSHFLLRLPSLYFSRVARIFEDANLSLPEIKKMVLETASQGVAHEFEIQLAFESASVPPAYKRLTSTWESFIDSVMREWKILNIISVLLLSAIMSILQIQDAAEDPLTRYTALFSLVCSLISLLFGCMYIIRFGSMRKSYKAAEWALEAQKTKTLIWWNVWILLAMPAIWLTWSIILYIVCIMSFVWRSGVTSTTPPGLSDTRLLTIRIFITIILGLGVLYGLLIINTFQRYGAVMDKAWKQRIDKWIQEKSTGSTEPYSQPLYPSHRPYPDRYQSPIYDRPPYDRPLFGDTRHDRPLFGDTHYDRPLFGNVFGNGRHPQNMHARTYVPTPDSSSKGSPHSTSSADTVTKVNELRRILSNSKDHDDTKPAAYIPNPGATPTPLDPKGPTAAAEESSPRRHLSPIPESPMTRSANLSGEDENNTLGFSSGLESRDGVPGGDAPGDSRYRVRFRLPSGDPRKTRS